MPLYKLTEKRLNKRAREDEDGTTRLKAALKEMGEGLGSESGSDEGWSDVSSDDEDDGDSDGDGDEDEDEDSDSNSEDGSDVEMDDESMEGEELSESGSQAEHEEFEITIESAVTQPIYDLPTADDSDSEVERPAFAQAEAATEKLCVLCPGKILKNAHMVATHLESNAHKRAIKRYQARLDAAPSRPITTTDPRDLVDEILAELEAGALAGPLSTTTAKAGTSTSSILLGDSLVAEDTAKGKRKGKSKAERTEEKARRSLSQVQGRGEITAGAGGAEKAITNQNGEGESGKSLNRKARRLLLAAATVNGNGNGGANKSAAERKAKPAEDGGVAGTAKIATTGGAGDGGKEKTKKRRKTGKASA